MNKLIIFVLTVHFITCLKLNHDQSLHNQDRSLIVGGFNSLNVQNLDEEAKKVDQYTRATLTDLKGSTLISFSRQVVNGFNNRLKYSIKSASGETKDWDIYVYQNFNGSIEIKNYQFKITTKEGKVFVASADPADAFLSPNTNSKTNEQRTGSNQKKESQNSARVYRQALPHSIDPSPY